MSETNAADPALTANASAPVDETHDVKTPTKRTPKRKADAFQKESEELLKTLGVSVDMEDGRRRTRSSARGSTAVTPVHSTPPSKRARASVSTPKRVEEMTTSDSKSTTPKKRGNVEPKKLLVNMEEDLEQSKEPKTDSTDSSTVEEKMDTTDEASSTVDAVQSDDIKEKADAVDKTQKTPTKLDVVKKDGAQHSTSEDASPKDEAPLANDAPKEVTEAKAATPVAGEVMEVDEKDSKPTETVEDTASQEDDAQESTVEKAVDAKSSVESQSMAAKETVTTTTASEEVTVEKANESNGNNVTTPEQTKAAPEESNKAVTENADVQKVDTSDEPSVQEVAKEAEPVKCTPEKNSDKTAAPNNVENNVADKVSTNVEPKIVSSEATAVEASPAP